MQNSMVVRSLELIAKGLEVASENLGVGMIDSQGPLRTLHSSLKQQLRLAQLPLR